MILTPLEECRRLGSFEKLPGHCFYKGLSGTDNEEPLFVVQVRDLTDLFPGGIVDADLGADIAAVGTAKDHYMTFFSTESHELGLCEKPFVIE